MLYNFVHLMRGGHVEPKTIMMDSSGGHSLQTDNMARVCFIPPFLPFQHMLSCALSLDEQSEGGRASQGLQRRCVEEDI